MPNSGHKFKYLQGEFGGLDMDIAIIPNITDGWEMVEKDPKKNA